jgi:hypothetical protein
VCRAWILRARGFQLPVWAQGPTVSPVSVAIFLHARYADRGWPVRPAAVTRLCREIARLVGPYCSGAVSAYARDRCGVRLAQHAGEGESKSGAGNGSLTAPELRDCCRGGRARVAQAPGRAHRPPQRPLTGLQDPIIN